MKSKKEQAKKFALSLAIMTAPYLFYFPVFWLWQEDKDWTA